MDKQVSPRNFTHQVNCLVRDEGGKAHGLLAIEQVVTSLLIHNISRLKLDDASALNIKWKIHMILLYEEYLTNPSERLNFLIVNISITH